MAFAVLVGLGLILWRFAEWGVGKWGLWFTVPGVLGGVLIAWLFDRHDKRTKDLE